MALAEADIELAARTRHRNGIGILVCASVLFGAMAVFVRIATDQLPAAQVVWVRFTGSLLLLLLVTHGVSLRPQPGNLLPVLLRGLLGALAISCYFFAISRIGAALGTLLHCTHPIPTALIGLAMLGEAPSRRLWLAIALSVAGIAVTIQPMLSVTDPDWIGVAAALIAAALAGGAVATARHLRATEDASLITIYFMAIGAIVTAPSLLSGVTIPSPTLALSLMAMVVTSAAGQWLLHHGLGFTSATQGSLVCATGVVAAALLEAVILGQFLSVEAIIGGALMIGAVGLAARY